MPLLALICKPQQMMVTAANPYLAGRKLPTAHRQALFEALYQETFPAAARFVHNMGGTLDDARDIFQDALVIYYEMLTSEKVKPHRSAVAYVLGITKHLWIRKYKKAQTEVALSDWESTIQLPEPEIPEPEAAKLLLLMEKAGEKCLNLLKSFYYDGLNVKAIAAAFGYSSERSATVQKYKCLEKLRNEVKLKSLQYEDFTS